MEKITICIIDKDLNYKTALMEYMKSYCRNYVVNMPNVKSFKKGEAETIFNSNDIMLISYDYIESFKDIDPERFKKKAIILLESFAKWNEESTEGFSILSKYTDIKKIVNYIDNHFYELNSKKIMSHETRTSIILCLGISGGAGTSSVAGGIAAELARYREKRVFYLSLDMFESDQEDTGSIDQERIVYSLIKNGFSNQNKIMENNMIQTADDVWRMPYSAHNNAILELEPDEKKLFIQEITQNDKFDYLVIDAGNIFDEFTEYLISEAENIVIIDSMKSVKSQYKSGLIEQISEIKISTNECLLLENFVDKNSVQTYPDAIPIGKYNVPDDGRIIHNIEFGADIRKAVDYLE